MNDKCQGMQKCLPILPITQKSSKTTFQRLSQAYMNLSTEIYQPMHENFLKIAGATLRAIVEFMKVENQGAA